MKLLFIARAYPPVLGGIENQNFELIRALKNQVPLKAITNPKGKKFLPIFYPFALIKALLNYKKYDVILLGDAVSAPCGILLKFFTKKPVYCIIHGLDISFNNGLYQKLVVQFCLKRIDKLIAVGNATRELAIKKGLSPKSIEFIPNGVRLEASTNTHELDQSHIIPQLKGKKFYLTLGRLIKRKGVAWFIEHVLPHIDEDIIYVIAGDGPEREAIHKLCTNHPNIIMTGSVSAAEKQWLLEHAHIFIQANIPVENDIEGFGLVVLEAGAYGTAVIASRLEGLQDAIHDTQNGFLAEPLNAQSFIEKIKQVETFLNDNKKRSTISQYTLETFSWDNIAKQYISVIETSNASSKSR